MAEAQDESKEDEVIVRMSKREWEYVKDIHITADYKEGFETLTPKQQDYTVKHLRDSVGIEFIAGTGIYLYNYGVVSFHGRTTERISKSF